MLRILAHDLGDGWLVVVARNGARHVEQLVNRDVLPRRILWQPFTEIILDRQLRRGCEVQDGDGRERLRDAADLEEVGRRDLRARVRVFRGAGCEVDVLLGSLQADAQRRRRDVLGFRARRHIGVECFLQGEC